MKIATWNVNGIRARQAEVQAFVERDRPDVLCLQEIKAASDQVPAALCEMEGYWCYWHGAKGYSGVALHVRREAFPDRPAFAHPDFDFENRIVVAPLGDLLVASTYVPNGGKDFDAKMRFLRALEEYAKAANGEGRRVVICGDLNVAHREMDVHPKERKPGIIGQRPDERDQFDRLLATGLVDVGRARDPENDQMFSWWAPWRNMRQRNIGWRLDYVLASTSVAERITACPVLADVGTSDHAPVMATLEG
ncbi:MAG: exodeoxyribonuclease III [Bacteroidales bacterium]